MLSHSAHVMTLANSIIGVGILAMPFCFQKCGIVLSIILLVLSNVITRVCCHYLIKTSLLTRRKSFELLGLHAFGASGKLLVELCIIGYLIGTCITYFVVVGDLGPQIIAKLFTLNVAEHMHLRSLVMVVVTVVCIVPLGMLRNVDSLSAVCTASIGFYVCLMLKIVLEAESHISSNDWTEKVVYWEPAGVLQCLPIFSMALSCQMQLFEVFESINNQSLDKLNGIVRNATWICTLVYIAVGFFGYVAFCTHTFSGNILVNLSTSFGSDIIKIGFVLSIAFSFPLVIFPCRASIYSLLYRKGHTESSSYIPEQRFRLITIFIVVFSLCVALVIPSVELIIGLVGSTIGVAICIMFPASSFRKIIKKESMERTLAQFIFVSGFLLMILGTYANLNAIDEKSSGPELNVVQMVTPLAPLPIGEFPKHLAKEPTEHEKSLLMEKLEAQKPDPSLNNIGENILEKPKAVLSSSSDNPPMPPLPIDEAHENEEPVLTDDKKSPEVKVLNPPDPKPDNSIPNTLTAVKPKESPSLVVAEAKKEPTKLAASNMIDGAAIKKEEDVAAEEQKESKANADELLKTQNELKETKKLLERTVDELNEELAKQKPLGQPSPDVVEVPDDSKIIKKLQKDEIIAKELKPKASLIEILTENTHLREEKEAHAGVYEPLSYKTGELLKNTSVDTAALIKRLPIPLAVMLLNATQPKVNNTSANDSALHKPNIEDNVEAIRRELLNLRTPSGPTDQPLNRTKREVADGENCLRQPKLKELNGNLAAASLHLQLESIGRDLKSIKDEDEETTTTTTTTVNESYEHGLNRTQTPQHT
ncbi:putative sodium-coupled neutral amino acid transporter 10 [Drosophila guanche]|uniref:Blast:Putative sodium-coupled neutral amino acid transporter 10 n=1 Tax=Drosophila guanche TaxID=7266 RepID=A0A3B0IYZ8_DROGU|nr:putative sodium-coupled neutral amino acid transporter 10 [Drosophila guanche]XP_034119979.1 putative sodium-coupled neutral amino acid transporter 10 [Drosophila guanche]SPP73464.1 blast:Putative sodium-coupled neutral amino acid transporter 10 [Drosophila guanche]